MHSLARARSLARSLALSLSLSLALSRSLSLYVTLKAGVGAEGLVTGLSQTALETARFR
jgi:hypothetical protein